MNRIFETFDFKITLGTILEVGILLFTIIVFWIHLSDQVVVVQSSVDLLWHHEDSTLQLVETIQRVSAAQTQELSDIQREITVQREYLDSEIRLKKLN